MRKLQVAIVPGGELSDITPTELGENQHVEVVNIRQSKIGEWETVKGYINHLTGASDLLNGVEVTLDETDERFLLLHSGTHLYRIDYDSGYDWADREDLTLPTDVSILSTQKLRFFVFRGVVRITGAVLTSTPTTQVPLWYGYIDRTLFPDGWEEMDLSTFESDTDGWTGESATVSQYDCDADADTSGMWGAPEGQYALKVSQTASSGYAKQSFTVEANKECRIWLKVYRASGGTGSMSLHCGSTEDATDYVDTSTSTEDEWVTLEGTFTPTGTTVWVTLTAGGNGEIAYYDYIYLEQSRSIVIQGWSLLKTALDGDILPLHIDNHAAPTVTGFDSVTILGKSFLTYDNGQFTLLESIVRDFDPMAQSVTDLDYEISTASYPNRQMELILSGTDLYTSWPNNRLTGLTFSTYKSDGDDLLPGEAPEEIAFNDDIISFRIEQNFDFTENLDDIIYNKPNFYYFTADKNRLRLAVPSGDESIKVQDMYFEPGQRVILKRSNNDVLETMITATNITITTTSYNAYIELADPIYPFLKSTDTDGELQSIGIVIKRKWRYESSNGYRTYIGVDAENSGGPTYSTYTGIGQDTEDINPAYSHHVVIEERAYCVSLEDEEEDVVRYSPLLQYDVFPNNNIIQTQVGDSDSVRAIAKRNDRLMILKRHSISQGNFVGGQYAEDIGLSNNGLFATDGYFSLEDAIFWMDKDDCYMFYGTVPQPLMRDAKMRKKYRENVSSNSFIAYDKLNNELWFVLDSIILVYHIEFKEWYERQTDITPLFAFQDVDIFMIVGAANKLVNYNHSESTFDESISYSIKTKLTDLLTPDYTKKTDEFILPIMSNQSVQVTVSDPNKTSTKTDTKTPNSGTIEPIRMRHRFLFKQLYVTIANTVASTTLYANIRKAIFKLGIWK